MSNRVDAKTLTCVRYVWVTADSETMGYSREDLERVSRFVAGQDILSTSSCLERKGEVILY